jgi:hypothetical protein
LVAEHAAGKLDSFTRRYLLVLGALAVVGLGWWITSLDTRVGQINDLLRADAELSSYPYTFRVLSLENGIADVSSPRSAQMSAIQGLRILFPRLQSASAVSAEMMAAQERLARVQSRAGELVLQQEGVNHVRWVLDEPWLARHGVYVQ